MCRTLYLPSISVPSLGIGIYNPGFISWIIKNVYIPVIRAALEVTKITITWSEVFGKILVTSLQILVGIPLIIVPL